MSVDNNKAMENRLARPDVRQKVTGAAKFAADMFPKNVVYAKFIRFPFGKGKVETADVEAARKVKGVISVDVNMQADAKYAGHSIGRVVAETRDAIDDAVEALGLKFRFTDPRSRAEDVYQGVPEASPEDLDKLKNIFDQTPVVVEATYTTQVQTHTSLEPHGSMVDHRGEELEAWTSTQAVMGCQEGFENASGLSASKITVHAEYVGGGFGSKFSIGAEGGLATEISKQQGRPCRVVLDRREEHSDGGNRPGSIQYMKIGADKSGKIIGGRVHLMSSVGFGRGRGGVKNPNYYDFGTIVKTEADESLNAGLPAAFRAPGYPQGAFAYESMIDELAAGLRMDPVEVRLKNETSDRRRKQLKMGAELIGWDGRVADGASPGRIKTGYGCGVASWGNGKGKCQADIDVYRNGDLEVRIGIQDIGTGASAVVIDVVAYHLGIDRNRIKGRLGNSNYPPGPGSGGSVTSRLSAPALMDAAESAMKAVRKIVAKEMKVADDEVEYSAGHFNKKGSTQKVAWKDACALLPTEKVTVSGEFNDEFVGNGVSDCAQFAQVEVDTETGIVHVRKVVAVHACGKPVNRLTAENQICGGVIQGISFALFEQRILDRRTGGHVNHDMLYYKIAGSKDVPEIIPVLDVEEGDNGVKSLGEPATIPTSAAIANAVANATGARVRHLPITPARVLAALDSAKGGVA